MVPGSRPTERQESVARPVLVGRAAELAALSAVIDAARRGETAALMIHGEPGAGKTTLLDAAAASAAEFTLLRATGVEAESDLPYAGLAELVAPVLDLRERIPAPQRAALERALAIGVEGAGDRFAVGAALVSLLGAAAECTPVLCLVDDLQWLDAASVDVLRFAGRRLGCESVALLIAVRGDAEPAVEMAPLPALRIGPLGDADAADLVGRLAAGPVAPAVAAEIVRIAAGNPLAIAEIVRDLRSEQLSGRIDRACPLPPGRSAAEIYAERTRQLSDAARQALLIVAAAGQDAREHVPAALGEAGLELADLEPAEERGLVAVTAAGIAFRHPLARSAAYHTASAPARRRAHAAVAAVLADGDRRRPWHLAAAATGPDEEIAAAMEAVADQARRQGGYVTAGHAHQRAAELTPDPERRALRLLAAAEDLSVAGALAEASPLLGDAAALCDTPAVESRLQLAHAELELRRGRPGSAGEIFGHEAERLADSDRNGAALIAMKAAFAAMLAGDVAAWRRAADRAMSLLGGDATPLASLGRALSGIARIAAGDPVEGRARLEGSVEAAGLPELLRSRPVPVAGTVEIHTLAAQAWIWLEEWRRAGELLDSLIGPLREVSAVSALVYPLTVRAWLDYRLGHWDAALAGASEAVQLGGDTSQVAALTGALPVRAVVLAGRGDEDGCRADAEAALEHVARAESRGTATYPRTALGVLALGLGRMEDAVEQLSLARDSSEAAGVREPGAMPWAFDLVEAQIRLCDITAARAALDVYAEAAGRHGRRAALAAAARCEGLLADDDALDDALARAGELLDELPLPFERARTHLCLGERLRRARRLTDARAPLREALDAFERLGAEPWAQRTRRELRATGAWVPAEVPCRFAELTAHEVQVAQLVADGLTNREIAAALFIAPKTVEHHLSRVYRKLGVRRRTELAAIAGELKPGSPAA